MKNVLRNLHLHKKKQKKTGKNQNKKDRVTKVHEISQELSVVQQRSKKFNITSCLSSFKKVFLQRLIDLIVKISEHIKSNCSCHVANAVSEI